LAGCGAGELDAATRATLPHSSQPVVGPVEITRTDSTYDVHGSATDALLQSIHAYASANWTDPEAAGVTNVTLSAQMQCAEYSDGGAIQSAQVHLDLRVTLPHWVERDAASPDLQRRWDTFLVALRAHEEGHVAIARDYGEKLRAILLEARPQRSCPILGKKVQELNARFGKAERQDQLVYDEKTKHGALQGCLL
jgi:predicted secreted Zn-dependent protease